MGTITFILLTGFFCSSRAGLDTAPHTTLHRKRSVPHLTFRLTGSSAPDTDLKLPKLFQARPLWTGLPQALPACRTFCYTRPSLSISTSRTRYVYDTLECSALRSGTELVNSFPEAIFPQMILHLQQARPCLLLDSKSKLPLFRTLSHPYPRPEDTVPYTQDFSSAGCGWSLRCLPRQGGRICQLLLGYPCLRLYMGRCWSTKTFGEGSSLLLRCVLSPSPGREKVSSGYFLREEPLKLQ